MANNPEITFHRNSFFELQAGDRTLFIDPVFTRRRRGRRVAEELRPCDYVLNTSMTPWFEDTLDVLDECEATLVASQKISRMVKRELALPRERVLDLEPWERASEDGMRLTAFPMTASIGMEAAIEEGASIVRDVTNVFPRGTNRLPMLGNATSLFDEGLRSVTRAFDGMPQIPQIPQIPGLQQVRSISRVGDMFGMDIGGVTGGRPGLAWLIEFDGFPTVLHMADGIHGVQDEEDMEDMADVEEPDILIVHVAGVEVEPLVRAVRILEPATVLLYRSRDPYGSGRRAKTLPMSSFIGAIEEGAPATEAIHMQNGDTFVLEPVPVAEAE